MFQFITSKKTIIIGIIVGMIGGYVYYYFIGCNSGSCSITSSPVNTTLYGGFIGWVLFDMFPKSKKNEDQRDD